MDVDWNAEVVDQLESHWQGQLRPRLEGLTDDEYFWKPVPNCWTLSRRGESTAPISFGTGELTLDYAQPVPQPEPVTTIAWRMAHVSVVFASTGGLGRAPVSESTYPYAGTAREALSRLDAEYDDWMALLRGLGTEGLSRPQGHPPAFAHAPMARKMLFTTVEVIHHGAEICLLRDLYLQKV